MRLLAKNETVFIGGEQLIAGDPNAGDCFVSSVNNERYFSGDHKSTFFGMVTGQAMLTCEAFGTVMLKPGQYFSIVGPIRLNAENAIVIRRVGYIGLNMIGGPVENTGRLRYIDGCTDTVLIAPPVVGDPCFNLLHFPQHVDQTMHTHPSLRCGITISGRGVASFPDGEVPLEPGSCWFLETGGQHAFKTTDKELLVCAWHPDTDTGPSHHDHPMLNRTMVDGISAKEIDEIRTK